MKKFLLVLTLSYSTNINACENDFRLLNSLHLPFTYPASLLMTGATFFIEGSVITLPFLIVSRMVSDEEYESVGVWVWTKTESMRCPL